MRAGGCGPLVGQAGAVEALDPSGESNFFYTLNFYGFPFHDEPNVPLGSPISALERISLRTLAWFQSPELGPGPRFGVTGLTTQTAADMQHYSWFSRDDRGDAIFRVGRAYYGPTSDVAEAVPLDRSVGGPFSLQAFGQGFLLSSRDDDQLLLLTPGADGGLVTSVLFDRTDDPGFRRPTGLVRFGTANFVETAAVIAGQGDALDAPAAAPASVYIVPVGP